MDPMGTAANQVSRPGIRGDTSKDYVARFGGGRIARECPIDSKQSKAAAEQRCRVRRVV